LVSGQFASSGAPISKPAPSGIPRHLREDGTVRNTKFRGRYARMLPPVEAGPFEVFGPNQGLLAGRRVSSGTVQGLTVLVQFQDVEADIEAAHVTEMLNGDDYTAYGNYCSVRTYYRLMSDGNLDYSNTVVGPITLSKPRSY